MEIDPLEASRTWRWLSNSWVILEGCRKNISDPKAEKVLSHKLFGMHKGESTSDALERHTANVLAQIRHLSPLLAEHLERLGLDSSPLFDFATPRMMDDTDAPNLLEKFEAKLVGRHAGQSADKSRTLDLNDTDLIIVKLVIDSQQPLLRKDLAGRVAEMLGRSDADRFAKAITALTQHGLLKKGSGGRLEVPQWVQDKLKHQQGTYDGATEK